MKNLNSQVMRTVDVARRAGYSVQQIRNLERDGVLPAAERTPTGHRVYREAHLHAALAYRALAAGAGPVAAKQVLRTVHTGSFAEALALLDAAHAQLHTERVELAHAKAAADAIAAEPIAAVRDSDSMTVSELAGALGVRASTLRYWDAAGLVVPDRDRTARRYTPSQVRDARIVHQLRRAGYRIPQLRNVLPELRRAHDAADVHVALAARDAALAARSRALLAAAAALQSLVGVGP
ncbi:MerR family transcriptional regulator [Nocardia brasiliensis]|uniref:MerR family transcriptional regulator n=1 Tax=Nocardia brasiliensis TaxID=37326 RepID=UPI00056A1C14|nr:MerR family transcriptional regulator [Nocardia brasiliensis]